MRPLWAGILGTAALIGLIAPVPAQAQVGAGAEASRWLPWIGCWDGSAETPEGAAEAYLVCFRPLADGTGVEIETYAGGALVAREEMRADGISASVEEEGCVGQQVAAWSSDGRRIFVSSDMNCGAGVTREARGTLAVLPDGRGWVEIHAVRSGDGAPFVGIRTFVPASSAAIGELGLSDPAAGLGLAVATNRARASEPLTVDALVELVDRAGPSVAGSLIAERGQPFELDARTLRALADRGVPGDVLDVIVAVTYPERFTVTGGDVAPARPTPSAAAQRAVAPWPARVRAYPGYSPWGRGYFGYYDSFRTGFGLGYGYGYGYDPFGYPYYGYPRVIVIGAPVAEERSFVLSRDRGVVPANPSGSEPPSGAPRATQRGTTPQSGTNQGAAPAGPPRSGGTGSVAPSPRSGSDSRGSSPSSTGSSDGERRAVPRSGG